MSITYCLIENIVRQTNMLIQYMFGQTVQDMLREFGFTQHETNIIMLDLDESKKKDIKEFISCMKNIHNNYIRRAATTITRTKYEAQDSWIDEYFARIDNAINIYNEKIGIYIIWRIIDVVLDNISAEYSDTHAKIDGKIKSIRDRMRSLKQACGLI